MRNTFEDETGINLSNDTDDLKAYKITKQAVADAGISVNLDSLTTDINPTDIADGIDSSIKIDDISGYLVEINSNLNQNNYDSTFGGLKVYSVNTVSDTLSSGYLHDISTIVPEIKAGCDTIHDDLISTNQKLDTLHTDLIAVKSSSDTLHNDLVSTNQKLDTLHTDLVAIKSSSDTLHNDLVGIKGDFDTIISGGAAKVVGKGFSVKATVIRPAGDTIGASAGDALGLSTLTGTMIEFPNVAREEGGDLIITNASIDISRPNVTISTNVHLYSDTIAAANISPDNSPRKSVATDLPKKLPAKLPFPAMTSAMDTTSGGSDALLTGLSMHIQCKPGATSIWGMLEIDRYGSSLPGGAVGVSDTINITVDGIY